MPWWWFLSFSGALFGTSVRGALWTVASGMGSRAIGLVGTLVITRFIAPGEYGEVTVAAVLVMTANQFSTIGLGQYLVARPDAPRSAAFHATIFHFFLGLLALALLLACGGALAPLLDAPRMARFLPGLALSGLFDRVAFVPERILVRDLRFGPLSVSRTLGDPRTARLAWCSPCHKGGAAIVMSSHARACVSSRSQSVCSVGIGWSLVD